MKNNYFIASFLLAFLISFVTITYLYPEVTNIFYSDSLANLSWFNPLFFVKVFFILAWQTSLLWAVFYNLAKKIF